MRQLFAALVLVVGLARPAAAQWTFTDWVQSREYFGCVLVESGSAGSCHRVTLQYGPIGPPPLYAGLTIGLRYKIEDWYFQPGGHPWQLRSVVAPQAPGAIFVGPTLFWEDAGGNAYCGSSSCLGYVLDDIYWRLGPLPVFDGYVAPDAFELRMAYLEGEGPEVGPTRLTTLHVVPEPEAFALLASGLAVMMFVRRRRRV